jgi:hypothetical protein
MLQYKPCLPLFLYAHPDNPHSLLSLLSRQEAAALVEMMGGLSLTSREIQTAVRLILPRELAKARPFARFVPVWC